MYIYEDKQSMQTNKELEVLQETNKQTNNNNNNNNGSGG